MMISEKLLLGAAVAGGLCAAPASAQDYVQVSTGVDYSSGDYGDTSDTTILAVPMSLRLNNGNFFVRASLPWLSIEGPGSVVGGDGGAVPGGSSGPVTRNSGIGDLSLSAGYMVSLGSNMWVDLTGRAKLPTASEAKNLGTGTTDFTAEAAVSRQFGPAVVSVRGGRRFNGNTARFPQQDVWLAGAGTYLTTGNVTLGLDYDWRAASLPTASDRSEVTASATYRLTPSLRLQGYGYTGFTNGSPNAGGGLQLLYRFGR